MNENGGFFAGYRTGIEPITGAGYTRFYCIHLWPECFVTKSFQPAVPYNMQMNKTCQTPTTHDDFFSG